MLVFPLALIGDSHVMGWGSKAIEIRAVENGQLDGVFMHKRTQKLRFLCERNDKVNVCMWCHVPGPTKLFMACREEWVCNLTGHQDR